MSAQFFKFFGDKLVEEQTAPVKEVIATLMTNEINRAIVVSMRKYLHADCKIDTIISHFILVFD